MESVMVLGAGYMGRGMAQACVNGGHRVLLWDITDELATGGKVVIQKGLDARLEKGKGTLQQRDELLERIEPTDDMNRAAEASLIIEAVVEDIEKTNSARTVQCKR